jgi:hypothetical protein
VSGPASTTPTQLWTPAQRRGIAIIFSVILLLLAVRCFTNRQIVTDPQPDQGPRYVDLADKIDPNTADRGMLAALPMLGEKRAETIIAYRDQYTAAHPGQIAFPTAESLMAIKGIGPAMTETLRPYLTFPPRRTQVLPGSGSRGRLTTQPRPTTAPKI